MPLVADPVGTVASLTERIRAESADMDTTRRVPTTDSVSISPAATCSAANIVSSAWAIDDRSET